MNFYLTIMTAFTRHDMSIVFENDLTACKMIRMYSAHLVAYHDG